MQDIPLPPVTSFIHHILLHLGYISLNWHSNSNPGNYGDMTDADGGDTSSTITSPAMAKNVISVGATLNVIPGA